MINVLIRDSYSIRKINLNALSEEFTNTSEVLHNDSTVIYFGLYRHDLLESVTGIKLHKDKNSIVICKSHTLPKFQKKGNYKILLMFVVDFLDKNYPFYYKAIWSKEFINIKKILGDDYIERDKKVFINFGQDPYILYVKNPS